VFRQPAWLPMEALRREDSFSALKSKPEAMPVRMVAMTRKAAEHAKEEARVWVAEKMAQDLIQMLQQTTAKTQASQEIGASTETNPSA
jgi:hypothetical protein